MLIRVTLQSGHHCHYVSPFLPTLITMFLLWRPFRIIPLNPLFAITVPFHVRFPMCAASLACIYRLFLVYNLKV